MMHSLGEDLARQIVQRVTGQRPKSVEVDRGPNTLTMAFRVRGQDGLHRYLFEGDTDTPPEHWRAALREICWHDGCWQELDPRARVRPGAPAWRACSLHAQAPAPSSGDSRSAGR